MERSLAVCVANLFKFCARFDAKTICLGGGNLGLVVIDFQSVQIAIWMVHIDLDRQDQPAMTIRVDLDPDQSGWP